MPSDPRDVYVPIYARYSFAILQITSTFLSPQCEEIETVCQIAEEGRRRLVLTSTKGGSFDRLLCSCSSGAYSINLFSYDCQTGESALTDTFETTLARIKSQKSILNSLDERAVEIGVVLPLLRQVGWDTENVSEIYPQHRLSDDKRVDYDLQIDGESRILIEVKSWKNTLDDDNERQLADYCRSAKPNKPKLAVLTSGRSWRLYLPPNQRKGAPLNRIHRKDEYRGGLNG